MFGFFFYADNLTTKPLQWLLNQFKSHQFCIINFQRKSHIYPLKVLPCTIIYIILPNIARVKGLTAILKTANGASVVACVMAKSAKKRYRITGLRRMAGFLGAAACAMARCCVMHQDDFSGLACIGLSLFSRVQCRLVLHKTFTLACLRFRPGRLDG